MPVLNHNEPATKFYGPQIGYFPPPPGSKIHLALHNVHPGEYAYPQHAAELHTPRILTPLLDYPIWRFSSTNYTFAYRHHFKPHIYMGTPYPPFEHIRVSWHGLPLDAFLFEPTFGVHLWAINLIQTFAGNVAYGGTCTLSYEEG